MNTKRVLITGFEAFGEGEENPTEKIMERITEKQFENVEIKAVTLPVAFKKARKQLIELLEEYKPHISISTGLWSQRSDITVERVGINVKDARIPDNEGDQPKDEPIVEEGPTAYFSTLPIRKIVSQLQEEEIPAIVSNSAGTFLCNFVLYLALHYGAHHEYPKKAGYMHFPYIPRQAIKKDRIMNITHAPSLPLNLMVNAVETAIKTSLKHD